MCRVQGLFSVMTMPRIALVIQLILTLLLASCAKTEREQPPKQAAQRADEAAPELSATLQATAREVTRVHAQRAALNDPWAVVRPDAREGLPAPMARPTSWRRGVSLGLFASEPDTRKQLKIYETFLDEIVATGATDISLVVRWKQQDITTTRIFASPDVTIDDALLVQVMQAARARRLRIFLLPIIYLEVRARGVWRGTLKPADPAAWWSSYEGFILHYARIAAAQRVALFSVGSELLSMEREDVRWRALIEKVRALGPMALTYSANWDHFEVPTFWDALDVAGLTAYQELTPTPNPDMQALNAGWSGLKSRLEQWSARIERPFIFTEIGFPAHREGAAHPWDYTRDALPAHALQARCYRSMFEVWHEEEALAGLYVWNWFGAKSADERGYTPRGKPAEEILTHWYTRSAP